MSSRVTRFLACIALAAGVAPHANAERLLSAVAPAAKSVDRAALSAGVAPSSEVVLEALPASKLRAIREKNSRAGTRAVQVGIVRDVPDSMSSHSQALQWQPVAGGHAAQWRVRADTAQAIRVALDVRHVAEGVEARFSSASNGGETFGQRLGTGPAWSPLISGEEAIVELFAPSGVDPRGIDVSIGRIADHFANPALPDAIAKSQWLAAPCQVDLVCEAASDPVLERAGAASIKLNWIEGYSAFACSGTLLNAADHSLRPYVYTASHCINDQAAADSLVTFWFYEKASCGGEDTRPAVQLAGGAQLLVASDTYDASLLRLNRAPPAGAVFAGWDSTPPSLGESLVALHHANGEVTKVSHGTVVAPPPYPMFALAWTSGIVQGGSSGSGAFSRIDSPRADLLMRGGLSSANSSCSAPGSAFYSRLDQVWPLMAPYLSTSPDYANATGLWWNAGEPGWGLTLSQQGGILFGVLFTYADDGEPSWLVASDMRAQDGVFGGALYRMSASGATAVGRMQVALANANEATLEYSVDGKTTVAPISRQAFNGFPAVCTSSDGSRAKATTYQDLWWNPQQPGWGLGLAQQGEVMFATYFTYDAQGRATWLVASNVTRQSDGGFAGELYRTSAAVADAGVKSVKASAAGAIHLSFADGEHGVATFTIDGRTSTQKITRQVFGPSPPTCR